MSLTCVIPDGVTRRYGARNFNEGNTMRALMMSLSLICLAGAAPAFANGHASHGPVAASTASAHFQAEPALAEHMHQVGTAVDALQHYEHGHMDQAQGTALATLIEDHVNQIIASCKLPPESHARLHAIIEPLLSHAGALRANPSQLEHVAPMRKAMQDYRQLTGVDARTAVNTSH